MGYQTLEQALSFKNNLAPLKRSILITDTLLAQGNFLVHHFIVNQIKADKHVVLVGLSQNFNHYLNIGRKLGVNLTVSSQKGYFSFIDGLTSLTINSSTIASTSLLPTAMITPLSITNCTKETLLNFYNIIKKIITTHHASANSNVLLIFDDLSVLIYSGFKVCDVLEFWGACRVLIEKYEGTLISLIHADEVTGSSSTDNIDFDDEIFIKSLIYKSEYLLSVRGLKSGFSRDVSGEITIARGPKNFEKWFRPITLHYKILDNNVQFFAKGFSQGVS
ncbi:elongator complex protein 6 [Gigaspora margarita]|uniref:Elongator complex protein 6 n=2 Tax=Gigaspora margarita TaxID=4874 RepID=A0A8H4A1I0_GIGMA|nr:elongator complex protein 6 [Gigaspora margarita]